MRVKGLADAATGAAAVRDQVFDVVPLAGCTNGGEENELGGEGGKEGGRQW